MIWGTPIFGNTNILVPCAIPHVRSSFLQFLYQDKETFTSTGIQYPFWQNLAWFLQGVPDSAHEIIPTPCLSMDGEFYPFGEYPICLTLKLTVRNWRVDAWKMILSFLGVGILSDTKCFMEGNSYWSSVAYRPADQRLAIEAQRLAIEALKEKRDLRSIVPWWNVWGDFQRTWDPHGMLLFRGSPQPKRH